MRAAVFVGTDKPLAIEDVKPAPPGPQDVVVEIAASGVCHSDLSLMRGYVPLPPGMILGHEGTGRVVEVGKEVTKVKKGDRVVASFVPACGVCWFCLRDQSNHCEEDAKTMMTPRGTRPDGSPYACMTGLGTFAEALTTSEHSVVPIHGDVPDEQLALIGCGVTTGVGAVVNTAKVEPGANVVVFGLGGIGLNVIQGAKMVGADKIVGVDINDSKEAWGKQFGMTHFVNPKKISGDIVAHLVELTGGGADYTFDCTGNTDVMRAALEACHRGWGVSVVIGVAEAGKEISTRPFQLVTGRVWKGSAFGGARGRTDVPKIVDWYMDGKIAIDPMITHVLSLEEINKGFDLMHEGKSIRSVVVF